MAHVLPPHIEAAQQYLLAQIRSVEKKDLDPMTTTWSEIERAIIKLLGGAFEMNRPEHQHIALGLAAMFGARLTHEHQAFWFPNREAVEGAAMGFPDALVMLSPFGAVVDALRSARLEKLGEVAKEIGSSLARAKFSSTKAPVRLVPEDYQRLFDPGFVQFLAVDPTKASAGWDATPGKLATDIKTAISRTESKLPVELRRQFETQILGALQRLDSQKPLREQIDRAPRIGELIGHLFGTVRGTSAAPEEYWQDIVLPLLHIGAPTSFPPLTTDELKACRKGVDPFLLFLDVVPYQVSAPEEGMLGAFGADELGLPHSGFERVGSLRLIRLASERIRSMVNAFDPQMTKDAVARFITYLQSQACMPTAGPKSEGDELLRMAITLISELKTVLEAPSAELHFRRITEMEGASESAFAEIRSALNGPRIILV